MSDVDDDVEAVLECLRSGWLTMGPRIQAFEAAFAAAAGAPHAIAVSSEPEALHVALAAAGVGAGHTVAVPEVGGELAAAAAARLGAQVRPAPVLSARRPLLDPARVPDADVVVVVHLAGVPAELPAGRVVVEDATGALGAAGVGLGDVTAFGLSDGRQVAVGEGAMLTARDETIAARARLLRSHAMTSGTWDRHRGHAASYDIVDIGFNARLDEPRAALGLSRLRRLGAEVERRRAAARAWRAQPGDLMPCFGDEDVERSSPSALVGLDAAGALVFSAVPDAAR